jgi:hypothetical protein
MGCGEKPKKQTQDNGGSQKKLAITCRGMTRCAGLARRKGHGKDKAGQRTSKGQAFRWRHQAKLEGNHGIRNQGSRQDPIHQYFSNKRCTI